MTILPIVERELRFESKRKHTYWSRVGVGFVGCLVLGLVLILEQFSSPGLRGAARTFDFIRFWCVIYCLLAGVRLVSDSISSEKREGTLGFLFLTHLRGHDVILGKMIAKGILPTFKLLAVVPMFWMIAILGGVGTMNLLFTVIALGNLLFLSFAICATVSTFLRTQRRCEFVSSCCIFILFFCVFPHIERLAAHLLTGLPAATSASMTLFEWLVGQIQAWANPEFALRGSLQSAWIAQGIVHLAAWSLVAIASWRVPHCWQDRPPAVKSLPLRERWRQWCYGSGEKRSSRRRKALDVNPFLWRATRNRFKPFAQWFIVLSVLLLCLAILTLTGFSTLAMEQLLIFLTLNSYLLPKLVISHEAARAMSEERQSGTLEMLLSTPLSIGDMIRGQLLGLRKTHGVIVVFPVLLFVSVAVSMLAGWLKKEPFLILLLAAGTLTFIADITALIWTAMWNGVKLGDASKASQSAAAVIIFIPAILSLLIYQAIAIWKFLYGGSQPSAYLAFGLWVVTGLTVDFLFIRLSRRQLHSETRRIVQEPALAEGSWGRILGTWCRKFCFVFRRRPVNLNRL